jgi:hypothetical protein
VFGFVDLGGADLGDDGVRRGVFRADAAGGGSDRDEGNCRKLAILQHIEKTFHILAGIGPISGARRLNTTRMWQLCNRLSR